MPNFNGTSGNDIWTGGLEAEIAYGGGGNDSLSGSGGDDSLVGGDGADTVNGGDGNDVLISGSPANPDWIGDYNYLSQVIASLDIGTEIDTLIGGDGDDRIWIGYGDNADGGTSYSQGDFLSVTFLGAPSGVTFDGRLATQTIGGGVIQNFENIDWVQGSNYDDTIIAGGGGTGYAHFPSTVLGMGGNDTLLAGYYTYEMDGGDGNDIVDGRGSQYINGIRGGAGNDILYAPFNGNSVCYGGTGNDTIYGDEFSYGGAGNDTIYIQLGAGPGTGYGDDGDDVIVGNEYINLIAGGSGADQLDGGGGDDVLQSVGDPINNYAIVNDIGTEHDSISGGAGNDTIVIGYGDDADGGAGNDRLILSLTGASSGVVMDLSQLNIGSAVVGGGVITNIEVIQQIIATDFADQLTLGTLNELIIVHALGGNDTITTGGSSARVFAGDGDDRIVSGVAADLIIGGTGRDTIDYQAYGSGVTVDLQANTGAGGDGIEEVEDVVGSQFADILKGDGGANTLSANGGNDTLEGRGGNDLLDGGVGDDSLDGGDGADWIIGGEGGDTIQGGAGDDTLIGALTQSSLGPAGDGADTLSGGAGNDVLYGNGGDDLLDGGANNDVLNGGAGSDTVDGGAGIDRVSYVFNSLLGPLIVDLRTLDPTAETIFVDPLGGTDTLRNIEEISVVGTGYNDFIYGSAYASDANGYANRLWGEYGNDYLEGAGQDDKLDGGDGVDLMIGGGGNDTFSGFAQTLNGDTITDFGAGDRILISDATLAGFSFSLNGGVLTYTGGSVTLQGVSGTIVAKAAAEGGVELTLVVLDARNDFNGDGRSDILWRHNDGTFGDWLANADATFASNGASIASVPGYWQIHGSGDFNGDGRDDILWRGQGGEIGNWLTNPSGGFAYNAAGGITTVSTSWQVDGIGDFNGDGRDDILWRNSDGTIGTWSGQANGGFVANNATIQAVPTQWHIAAVGDFNGDGKDDILWRHDNGVIGDWLANEGGTFSANASLIGVSNDWHIVGAGDFNGDNRDDILWRHDNGTIANWTANADGTFSPNFASLAGIPNDWHIASIGDYNGDGRDDILWRHDNGTVADWTANANNSGTFTPNNASLAGVPNDWHVQDQAILLL